MDKRTTKTLVKLRAEIDLIDDKLIELLSNRDSCVKQMLQLDISESEIKSQDRINFVIERVRKKAIKLGLSPNFIHTLFTNLMNEMVEKDISAFKNKNYF